MWNHIGSPNVKELRLEVLAIVDCKDVGWVECRLVTLIDHAKVLLDRYPRADLPDWVEALANGEPDNPKLLAVVLDDMKEESNGSV